MIAKALRPTQALKRNADGDTCKFDSRLCLNYQTIENRGEIPDELAAKLAPYIYGCDRCQSACPWNRFAVPNTTPELQPSDELLAMKLNTKDGAVMVMSYGNSEEDSQEHTGSQLRIAAYGPHAANVVGLTDQTDLFYTHNV